MAPEKITETVLQIMTTQQRKARSKQDDIKTPLAYRSKRLGLNMRDVERLTREPYGSILNWKQGRRRCPRSVLRLLAIYRIAHWGKF